MPGAENARGTDSQTTVSYPANGASSRLVVTIQEQDIDTDLGFGGPELKLLAPEHGLSVVHGNVVKFCGFGIAGNLAQHGRHVEKPQNQLV